MNQQKHQPPAVRLRQIDKYYGLGAKRSKVIQELDADFNAESVTLIRGNSGCGKSTLLNLIGGIDLPDSGRVEVLGMTINRSNDDQRTLFRRAHIGYVFQFFNLLPNLTVEENIRLPLQLLDRNDAADLQRVGNLLEILQLNEIRHQHPDTLSGGEQQRVALGRAIVHQPELLLADEPTGNLDEGNGIMVMEKIRHLAQQDKITVIMVSHSREAAEYADSIFHMSDGRMRA